MLLMRAAPSAARGGGPRLVVRHRVPARRAVLAGAQPGPRAAARGGVHRRAVDRRSAPPPGRCCGRRSRRCARSPRCAVVPSCWLVADWVRSWQGFGGPWAVYGASQWQHPAILALAAVGGVWLVSFALVAANTGILIAADGPPHPGPADRRGRRDRRGRGGPGRVRADLAARRSPGTSRSRWSSRAWCTTPRSAPTPASGCRPAWPRSRRPDRLGREQRRGRPEPAQLRPAAAPARGAVGGRRRAAAGEPGLGASTATSPRWRC